MYGWMNLQHIVCHTVRKLRVSLQPNTIIFHQCKHNNNNNNILSS